MTKEEYDNYIQEEEYKRKWSYEEYLNEKTNRT